MKHEHIALQQAVNDQAEFLTFLRQKSRSEGYRSRKRRIEQGPHPTEELLHDYVWGALDRKASRVIRTHAAFCSGCMRQLRRLAQIRDEMLSFREAGIKVISRFAYANEVSQADAELSTILAHLEQLKPVLLENKDVIAVMQAGFIGAWGEWYYSTNHLDRDDARAAVLDKILTVLPLERQLQVRTPAYKRTYLSTQHAIEAQDAFSEKAIARIGHHNDCFLASVDDIGTYTDVEVDKAYLHAEGLYVPIGGETCPPNDIEPADCAKAQSEMRHLRWSYLNQDYYHGVNDRWIEQGCMAEITRNMGYRLVLRRGFYSTKHSPGSSVSVSIELENVGYASMYNPRKVELILESEDKKVSYMALLPDDPRLWQPDMQLSLKAEIALPEDIPAGSYRLYLFLPDPEMSLHNRVAYAVRLANRDCWEDSRGYNDLGVRIVVDASLDLPASQSFIRFHKVDS